MKRFQIIIALILITTFISSGQRCDSCKNKFDQLFDILNQENITAIDLQKSLEIAEYLYSYNYSEYIDSIVNDTQYFVRSLTRTFYEICIKSDSKIGIDFYFKYLDLTYGSSEEERSCCLERLFVRFPEIVMDQIGNNKDLLNSLTFGFLNNRYCGVINPYENQEFSAFKNDVNKPKRILSKHNCRDIFFKTNPIMLDKYEKYKLQIEYILKLAYDELEDTD